MHGIIPHANLFVIRMTWLSLGRGLQAHPKLLERKTKKKKTLPNQILNVIQKLADVFVNIRVLAIKSLRRGFGHYCRDRRLDQCDNDQKID